MCVMSMVMQHYWDKWHPLVPSQPYTASAPYRPLVSPEEVDEFRRLLDRAREYDRKHNQPDCETDDKRAALKKVADALGLQIDFV